MLPRWTGLAGNEVSGEAMEVIPPSAPVAGDIVNLNVGGRRCERTPSILNNTHRPEVMRLLCALSRLCIGFSSAGLVISESLGQCLNSSH